MKSDRKALAALVGAIAAALAVGYGTEALDPLLGRGGDKAAIASADKPETAVPTAAPAAEPAAKAETPAAEPAEKQTDVAAVAPDGGAKTETEPEVTVPAFDLLRVEPSGDMVIAGTAAAGSSLEIVSGDNVLAKVQAGASGDFAAVLDDPLKPGDYQIVLRATGPDGTVANSTGTAIVSVPETDKGEVLALVEEPGKASRLISVTGGTGASAAAAAPAAEAEKPAETAATEAPTADAQGASPEAQKPAETAQAPAAEPAAPAEAPKEETVAKTEEPAADAGAAATGQGTAQEQAAAPATDAVKPEVAIEAVEIEGDSVFVAGAAKPGETVRVYANDILLGDSKTSPQGRFLIEAKRDLPQGDYIIRADVIGADGAQVVARAAVPFQREAGEKVAAVAPTEQPTEPAPESGDQAAASATVEEKPADTAGATGQSAAQATGEQQQATSGAATQEPATESAAAGTSDAGAATGADTQVAAAEPTAQPLKPVDHPVIIRRGDTLWRISRRVYGRGTRYTTIYKANQTQIRNPNLIFPGQTFMVPDKSEEGETANMERL